MPKKIALEEKRKWLQLFQDGKPESEIAKETKKDLKTIKNGIEEARLERYATTAQAEMIKEALKRHQNSLLSIINRILSALQVPAHDLPLTREPNGSLSRINLSRATLYYDQDLGLVLTLPDEGTTSWELLRNHLKRDHMWKALATWKKSLIAHVQARSALKLKAEMTLGQKTGYKVVDGPTAKPFLYSYTSRDLLYQALLNKALGIPDDNTNPEDHIVADTQQGVVRWDMGTILAEAPSVEEKCRDNILDAFKNPKAEQEVNQVAITYEEVKESTEKARRAVEEISLLGLVPGRCRVCRRLGI